MPGGWSLVAVFAVPFGRVLALLLLGGMFYSLQPRPVRWQRHSDHLCPQWSSFLSCHFLTTVTATSYCNYGFVCLFLQFASSILKFSYYVHDHLGSCVLLMEGSLGHYEMTIFITGTTSLWNQLSPKFMYLLQSDTLCFLLGNVENHI